MPRVKLLISILVFINLTAAAQLKEYEIKGQITDSLKNPLPAATIVLLQQEDSVMSAFTVTDNQGSFDFRKVKAGNYLVQISFMGYRNFSKPIQAKGDNPILDMGLIDLDEEAKFLDEITVNADRIPIVIKQDTIEYNADAFKTKPNDVVEDLLRKLPGVEVDRDGNVKAQGEDVNKVLVDGKEFFGNDSKIATRNLPADAVDKVQVFDKMSDFSEFTGIDDGNRDKTINLALKEDKKKGYFGRLTGGYGTDERYEGRINLNRFNPKTQMSLLGATNNTNQQNFSINDYINFMGGLQGLMSGRGGIIQIGGDAFGGGQNQGITTARSGGLNLNHDFSKNTELSLSYFFNQLDNQKSQLISRQNFLDTETFLSEEENLSNSDNFNHRVNLKFKHKLDDTQDLAIRSGITFNKGGSDAFNTSMVFNTNSILENQSITSNFAEGDQLNFTNNFLYRKKLGKNGRNLVSEFILNKRDNGSNNTLNSENEFFDSNNGFRNTINQDQITSNDQFDLGAKVSYTEPLGKKRYLEFRYEYRNYDNELIKDFYDLIGGQVVYNNGLSSFYRRDYTFNRGGVFFTINREKYNLTAGGNFQSAALDGKLVQDGILINKDFRNVLPSLQFRYNFSNSKNLKFRYNTAIREPSLQQLQPVVDNSDPLNIYVGNPDLKAEYNHRGSLNYMSFDQFNSVNLFVSLTAMYTKNKIANTRTIDQFFVQTTRPVNTDREWVLRNNVHFGAPLKFMGSKFNLSASTTFNRGTLFINANQNTTDRLINSVDFGLENRKKKAVDLLAGTRLTYNQTTYSRNKELDQDFLTRVYYTDFTLTFLKTWTFNVTFDYSVYGGDAFENTEEIPILRAYISKDFLKYDRGQLRLTGFDLLNENQGVNRNSDFNYIEEERLNVLNRYFILSFTYSLRGAGGQNTKVDIIHAR